MKYLSIKLLPNLLIMRSTIILVLITLLVKPIFSANEDYELSDLNNAKIIPFIDDTYIVGCSEGLFLIEGNNLKYLSPDNDKSAVTALFLDTISNDLIYCSKKSLSILNMLTLKNTLISKDVTQANDIKFYKGNYYISTMNDGLWVYHISSKSPTKLNISDQLNDYVAGIEVKNSTVYIGTHSHGIITYDTKTNKKSNIDLSKESNPRISSLTFFKNKLFVTTFNGLYIYDIKTSKCSKIPGYSQGLYCIKSYKNNFYLGAKSKVVTYSSKTGKVSVLSDVSFNDRKFIYDLHKDDSKIIMATKGKGITIQTTFDNSFKTQVNYLDIINNQEDIGKKAIGKYLKIADVSAHQSYKKVGRLNFMETKAVDNKPIEVESSFYKNHVFLSGPICSINDTLNAIGSDLGVFLISSDYKKIYDFIPTNKDPYNIHSIVFFNNQLWMTSLKELYIYDFASKTVKNIYDGYKNFNGKKSDGIIGLFPFDDSIMFVGYNYDGLDIYKKSNEVFEHLSLIDVEKGNTDYLNNTAQNIFKIGSNQFIIFSGYNDNYIIQNEKIVNKFSFKTADSKRNYYEDFMQVEPRKFRYNSIEEKSKILELSLLNHTRYLIDTIYNNEGYITSFSYTKDSNLIIFTSSEVAIINKNDSVKNNLNALVKEFGYLYPEFKNTDKDILYCFDRDALMKYNLSVFDKNNFNSKVYLRNLKILGKTVLYKSSSPKQKVEYSNGEYFISATISNLDKLELTFREHAFSFEYKAIDYNFQDALINCYYMLDGYDYDWHIGDAEGEAVYQNITPGKYTFRIKSKNITNSISDEKRIEITITPPWYKTIVAYIIYIVLVIILLFSYIKIRERKLIEERNLLEEKVKERTVELEQANEEITSQNEEITSQRDEIEAQRDSLFEQKQQIEKIHEEVEASISYAERIQLSILPDEQELQGMLEDYFILFKPRDIVSGDFYWFKKVRNFLVITAADCTGHGVPGAFMSMLGVSFLNEIVSKSRFDSSDLILNRLREKVKKALKQKGEIGENKDGMDMALCVINLETKELQFSGAYNPLYIIRNGELIQIKADRQPIAVYSNEKPFTLNTHQLEQGDYLYMFSDGFSDQFGGKDGKKFMSKRFKQMLLDNHQLSLSEQKEVLDKTFNDWKNGYEQMDDILVIGLKI